MLVEALVEVDEKTGGWRRKLPFVLCSATAPQKLGVSMVPSRWAIPSSVKYSLARRCGSADADGRSLL